MLFRLLDPHDGSAEKMTLSQYRSIALAGLSAGIVALMIFISWDHTVQQSDERGRGSAWADQEQELLATFKAITIADIAPGTKDLTIKNVTATNASNYGHMTLKRGECPELSTPLYEPHHGDRAHGDVCRGLGELSPPGTLNTKGLYSCPLGCSIGSVPPYCAGGSHGRFSDRGPCRPHLLSATKIRRARNSRQKLVDKKAWFCAASGIQLTCGGGNEPGSAPSALDGSGPFERPTICEPSGIAYQCPRDGRGAAMRTRLVALLARLVGPKGILFFVGDSTLRYQFSTFCRCTSVTMCNTLLKDRTKPGAKVVGPRRLRSCGANDMSPTVTSEPLVVFDEIAGGTAHYPWTDPANHAAGSLQRLEQLVNRTAHGRLVVYANVGALHLLWNKPVGWPDIRGFFEVEKRIIQETADYRSGGAGATIFMLPHWVCVSKLPLALQRYINPNRTDNRAGDKKGGKAGKRGELLETNMVDDNDDSCTRFLRSVQTNSKWSAAAAGSTHEEHLTFCRGAYLNAAGAANLRRRMLSAITGTREAHSTNTAELGVVDGYTITKNAGCEGSPDGRHWPENVVLTELDVLFSELERMVSERSK